MTTKTFRGAVRTTSTSAPQVRAASDGSVRISGWASRPVLDRYKEIIDATAWSGTLQHFLANSIMLVNHDVTKPIGRFDVVDPRPEGLWVSGVGHPGTTASDEAINRIKAGILKTFSVGFRELNGEYDAHGVYHITGAELYEISVVAIPALRDALFEVDDAGALKAVRLLDEDDENAAVRRVLRRVRQVIAEQAADQAYIAAACRLLYLALQKLEAAE